MMEDPAHSPVVWTLVVGCLLALLLGSAVRRVTTGRVLVVTRRGVIRRVHGPGLALRLPLLDTVLVVDTTPRPIDLHLISPTADDHDVRVLFTATVRSLPPVPGDEPVDPQRAVHEVLGPVLAARVRAQRLDGLVTALEDALEDVLCEVFAPAAVNGVEVLSIEIAAVEHLLAPSGAGSPV